MSKSAPKEKSAYFIMYGAREGGLANIVGGKDGPSKFTEELLFNFRQMPEIKFPGSFPKSDLFNSYYDCESKGTRDVIFVNKIA